MPRIDRLLPHAKQRLWERYGMARLPDGPREYVRSFGRNRRVYRIGEIYFVWRKSDKAVVTVLPP